MRIGEVIKEKRIECQLTQEQLSEKIFVSKKTISNWETGKTIPDIDSLIRLAHLFNLSLDNLLLEGSDIVKDIKKKEKVYNNQSILTILFSILVMTFIGYYSFDNWASIIIFGFFVGGIFGYIIDSIGKN